MLYLLSLLPTRCLASTLVSWKTVLSNRLAATSSAAGGARAPAAAAGLRLAPRVQQRAARLLALDALPAPRAARSAQPAAHSRRLRHRRSRVLCFRLMYCTVQYLYATSFEKPSVSFFSLSFNLHLISCCAGVRRHPLEWSASRGTLLRHWRVFAVQLHRLAQVASQSHAVQHELADVCGERSGAPCRSSSQRTAGGDHKR